MVTPLFQDWLSLFVALGAAAKGILEGIHHCPTPVGQWRLTI